MKKQSNTPHIRFQNYEDEWMYSTIGRHISLLNGRAYKQEELLDDGKYKVLRVGNFNTNSKWYYSNLELEDNKYVNKGELLYLWATNFGPEIWMEGKAIYHYHIWKLEFDKTNINQNYLYIWLESDKNKIQQNTNGSTMVHITKTMMEERRISLPSQDEQCAIGSLFHTLDDLLASYKDNLTNYQSLKANMLSKMFPKDGQTVPEIRLDGFEGEWEINKLNKYLTVSKKKNTKQQFGKEDVLSVSGEVGIVNQIQFQGRSFAGVSVEMYSIVETGNIVYTKSPLKANPYGIIKTNYGIPGIVSTLYAVYLPYENVFPGFVERYFENDLRLNSYLKPLVNKGAKNDMKVSDKNALLGNVIFPKLEEQVAISDYFTNLDKFIQSHKDKISQLETLKKKLLQDMFI